MVNVQQNRFPGAIIVGASRGIGFQIALKFLKNFYNVTVVSRNEKTLLKSVELLKAENRNCCVEYRTCDVSSENDVKKTCSIIIDRHKQLNQSIDVLVNSAGIAYDQLLISSSDYHIRNTIETNLIGTISFTKLICKQMIKQKNGSIINIGSIVGMNGGIGQSVYSASKSGLVGFTKSLAQEIGRWNIRANLIIPGFIQTDMTTKSFSNDKILKLEKEIPLQRIGSAIDVADATFFLATSSFMTGSALYVDGGLSLLSQI